VHRDSAGGQWIAKSELGMLWYDASDLADKDIAPFAMLDTPRGCCRTGSGK
jgi:hypothetical protein